MAVLAAAFFLLKKRNKIFKLEIFIIFGRSFIVKIKKFRLFKQIVLEFYILTVYNSKWMIVSGGVTMSFFSIY